MWAGLCGLRGGASGALRGLSKESWANDGSANAASANRVGEGARECAQPAVARRRRVRRSPAAAVGARGRVWQHVSAAAGAGSVRTAAEAGAVLAAAQFAASRQRGELPWRRCTRPPQRCWKLRVRRLTRETARKTRRKAHSTMVTGHSIEYLAGRAGGERGGARASCCSRAALAPRPRAAHAPPRRCSCTAGNRRCGRLTCSRSAAPGSR